jgi:hypothetical protein
MALAAGAIGITCAKLGEAEVLAASGVKDILVANQIVGQRKIERLLTLRERADVKVAVVSPDNAREISRAAASRGLRIGLGRAGARPGEAAVELIPPGSRDQDPHARLGLPVNRHLIMVFIALIYLAGGSFLDDLAFMILATPIFFSAVVKLGFDPLWFGMLIAITAMIGVVIPPVAMNVFVVKNITKVPFGVIYRGVVPFLTGLTLCAALLFVLPQLASLLMK